MFNIVDNNDGYQREIFAGLQKYKYLCSNFDKWFRLQRVLTQDALSKLLIMYCKHTQTIITKKVKVHLKTNRIYYEFGCYFASQKFAEKGCFKELCPLRVQVSTKPGSSVFKIEATNLIHNHLKIDQDSFHQLYTKMLRILCQFSTNRRQGFTSSSLETNILNKEQQSTKMDNFDDREHNLIVKKADKMDKDANLIRVGVMKEIQIIEDDNNIMNEIQNCKMNCRNDVQYNHDLIRPMDCNPKKAGNGTVDTDSSSLVSPVKNDCMNSSDRLIIQEVVSAIILRLNQRK